MEDRFTRYTKLYIYIFLLFLSIPVILILFLGIAYGFSKLIPARPAEKIFQVVLMAITSAIFFASYYLMIRKTRFHPSKAVKIISYILLVLGAGFLMYVLVSEFMHMFKKGLDRGLFSVVFLAVNFGLLFIVAVIQAATTQKEKDWMEKVKDREKGPIM